MTSIRSLAAGVALALTLSSLPMLARADDEIPDAPRAPVHRVDVVLPSVGLGHYAAPDASYARNIGTVSADVRYAHRSGHGVMLRLAYGTNVWGEAWGGELDYLYRVLLVGHEDISLGVDLTLGPTVSGFDHDQATLAVGVHLGGNGGVSLDLRARNFIASLGGQYRLFVPLEPALNGGDAGVAHAFTASIGAGFTFY